MRQRTGQCANCGIALPSDDPCPIFTEEYDGYPVAHEEGYVTLDELAERIAEAFKRTRPTLPKIAARIAADVARDWFDDQLPDPEPVEDYDGVTRSS